MITAPLLMQLPETEYYGMMQLYDAMVEHGRAVEMRIFPGAYHHKNRPAQRLAVYERNLDWAMFWLRGVRSPDAGRASESARWAAMLKNQCSLFQGEGTHSPSPWYCR
jgi:hypothetical protein